MKVVPMLLQSNSLVIKALLQEAADLGFSSSSPYILLIKRIALLLGEFEGEWGERDPLHPFCWNEFSG